MSDFHSRNLENMRALFSALGCGMDLSTTEHLRKPEGQGASSALGMREDARHSTRLDRAESRPEIFPVCEMLHGESSLSPKGGSPEEDKMKYLGEEVCDCETDHRYSGDYYDMDREERGEGPIESEEEDA